MFEHRPNLTAVRGFLVAACLVLLAGCGPGAIIPLAPVPTNLAATAGNAKVTLTWTASSGATSYNVKRATSSGGPFTQLASPTAAGYTDTSVTNDTTYYYVVSALDAGGESATSAPASAAPQAPTPPPVPTNLAAVAGDTQVVLSWSASSGATSYHVKRATTNGGPYAQIATPTTPSYTDTSLNNGTTYYYVVSALNAVGESANSTQASAIPTSAGPTNFGTWTNVTPAGVDLVSTLCSNYGAQTVQQDPVHPSNLYTSFGCQGIWKSTDYGVTWNGPINMGSNAAVVSDCSGGLTISPTSTASVATIYQSCIRGNAIGFWKSVDGGVTWTNYVVTPTARQDYYPPVVDPYDQNHLIMVGHEFDSLVESMDGGVTWASVAVANGMLETNRSPAIFFIDTGTASTTRGTWLWLGDLSGGAFGTWRTTNSGAAWVQVDKNEHASNTQIYQPDKSGVVYMSGNYSALGAGVLRSTDYGQTWTHVGLMESEAVVTGTSKYVYAMYGFPVGLGGSVDPSFQVGFQPGTGTWVAPGTPAALNLEGVAQICAVNDGTHNVLVGAMWNSGVWRYVEP